MVTPRSSWLRLLYVRRAQVLVEAHGWCARAGCALAADTAQMIEAIYMHRVTLAFEIYQYSLTLLVAADTCASAARSTTCPRAHVRQRLTETAAYLDQVRCICVRRRSVATFLKVYRCELAGEDVVLQAI